MKPVIPALLAMAVSFSSMESMAAVDLILHNGKIFTGEPGQGFQQALAVSDGKVLQVGASSALLALKESGTQVVDLGGKVLMPGLIDSHSHAIFGGLELASASAEGQLLPFDELERRLRDGKAKQGDILSVGGMPSAYWSQLAEFDKRFNQGEWAQVPIFFIGWDHHTGWANRAMLKRAGIDQARVAALQGEARNTIGHDEQLQPNGFLADAGLDPAMAQMPAASDAQLLEAGRAALRYNHQLGITAWMDPAANGAPGEALFDLKPTAKSVGILPVYKQLAERGELNAHVAALLVVHPKSRPADLDVIEQVREQFQGVPNLTLPGIKVFADGVP
ncbi:MAG: amidohydrolase family protein, partial [Pseudomonas sp.]